jgi:hypothetical protein
VLLDAPFQVSRRPPNLDDAQLQARLAMFQFSRLARAYLSSSERSIGLAMRRRKSFRDCR